MIQHEDAVNLLRTGWDGGHEGGGVFQRQLLPRGRWQDLHSMLARYLRPVQQGGSVRSSQTRTLRGQGGRVGREEVRAWYLHER